MRPALALSTRRAKSSHCLLKQCFLELENSSSSSSTTTTAKRTFLTSSIKPLTKPPLPVLWFLVTRSINSQSLNSNQYRKLQPRNMNKDIDLDSLLSYISTKSLSKKDTFRSLRTALYNTTQYDASKAWAIYQAMIDYGVDKYLKSNHYGFLLCVLKYADTIPRMLTVLENMKAHGEAPNAQHISQVLFSMSRGGMVREAYDLIRITKSSGSSQMPTSSHYHSLAVALKNTKLRDPAIVENVTKMMIEGMHLLNNATLSIMLSLLSSRRHAENLTLLFLKAMDEANHHSEKHPYNVYIYTSLIAGFARQGDNKSATRLFEEMQKHSIEPTQVTYSAMIEANARAGDFKTAHTLLLEYRKRYRHITNHVVTSLLVNAIRHNNHAVAESTVEFIDAHIDAKNRDSMLRTAMLWFKTKQNLDEARKEFDALYQQNTELVNTIMVNHLVTGYGNKGDKKKAIESFDLSQKLPSMTKEADVRAKHHLTHALFKCRDVPAAMRVFASMRSQQVPDDITIAMVVKGLVMNNEGNLAWRLFKTLQSDGIEPNLHAYSSMLKALGHRDSDIKKEHDTAHLDPELMAAAGIRSHADYLRSPVPVATEAHRLFRHMTGFQQPNAYTYTTLVSCFAKHNIAMAISVFDQMCAKGVQPTVETYTALLQGCSIFRNSQMALKLFNHMQERRIEPNAATWRYLLKSLLRSRVDSKEIDKVGDLARKSLAKLKK